MIVISNNDLMICNVTVDLVVFHNDRMIILVLVVNCIFSPNIIL